MNTLARWNPFHEMETLQRKMSSLLQQGGLKGGEENMSSPDWAPLVDIAENDKEYLIKVELPEVRKEDLKVTVNAGTLTIAGERRVEPEEKNHKYHRIERQYGRFERNFIVPENAVAGQVKAEFQEGVLHVRLPKSENARARQITIEVK